MQGEGGVNKIIYKELSYEIVGVLFEVYNELGYGHPEKYYYRAIGRGFKIQGIKYRSQVSYKLIFKDEIIGRYYLDFLIENKIVLEIKKGNHFSKKNIEQVKSYLEATGMKLAILANFTPSGVKFLRILNI